MKRIIWTTAERSSVIDEMANIIRSDESIRTRSGSFSFTSVVQQAQEALSMNRSGRSRKFFSTQEAEKIRKAVERRISFLDSKNTPVIKTRVVESSPKVAEQAPVDDHLKVMESFISSTEQIAKLLLSEKIARQELELKLILQQQRITAYSEELEKVRTTLQNIEEILTKPSDVVVESSRPATNAKISLEPKAPRVIVIGMDDRNHAQLNKVYGGNLNLKFFTGDKKTVDIKVNDNDKVLVAVDYCSHAIYDKVMDEMKRRGLKDNITIINGGMTAISDTLAAISQ